MSSRCGCKIKLIRVLGEKIPSKSLQQIIDYCPTHAAAFQMADALAYWERWVPELSDEDKNNPIAVGIYKNLRKTKRLLEKLTP